MTRPATARRDAFKTRLGIDGLPLERREVPALLSGYATSSLIRASGSLASTALLRDRLFILPEVKAEQSGDTLYITGTAGDDTVRASNNSGTVQVDASSQGRVTNLPTKTFYNVKKIQFVGNAGNDTFVNDTDVPAAAWGGAGNDTLTGGSANDTLVGGADNDAIDGRGGDDRMWGEGGRDSITGGAGNDYEDGGAGNDRLAGYWVGGNFVDDPGNDTVFAGAGDDWSDGGSGNDWMQMGADNDFAAGGVGNDTLFGEGGNDVLHGWEGDDELQGGEGNDVLFGQAGRDRLFGDGGNDVLFGGAFADRDTLTGGAGADLFLPIYLEDVITDLRGEDARVNVTSDGMKFWAEAEVQTAAKGLAFLLNQTGNTRLLKLSTGGEFELQRVAYLGKTTAADNDSRGKVRVADWAFTNGVSPADESIVHELGHNWDTEMGDAMWGRWLALSGWKPHDNGPKGGSLFPPYGYINSKDGAWDYRDWAAGGFARDYGKTNPREDLATTWEAYYAYKSGTLSAAETARLKAKLDFVEAFMASKR